ncbi:hypothetical protein BH10ACI4_BH10ACI4_29240 [soil metagenome]
MPRVNAAPPLNQPDPRVLHILAALKRLCLLAAATVATISPAAALFDPLGKLFSPAWSRMPVVLAICTLLTALSLFLSMPSRSSRALRISARLALVVILVAGYNILHSLLAPTGNPANLAASTDPTILPASFAFVLLGALTLGLRVVSRIASECIDALTVVTCAVMLVFFYRFTLGSAHLIDVSSQTQLAPTTILCLALLTFVAFNLRAEHGIFCVLLGPGIAGKTARLAAPFALGLPVIRSIGRGYIHAEYVTALASLAAFCLILIICLRIHSLEREVSDLSLRDELTGLYNRRGFNVLAEQAHRLARRSAEPFSVLFIDLDNLKQINDFRGHEAGSALLREMADLLRNTFRETDVIARLGGDEFVVAGRSSAAEIAHASERLTAAATRVQPITLSFSLGHITADRLRLYSLEEMIQRADQRMYEKKRSKKNPQTAASTPNETLQIVPAGSASRIGRHLPASLLTLSSRRTPPCPAPSGPVKSKFPSSPSV